MSTSATALQDARTRIANERLRQVTVEGYTHAHDRSHGADVCDQAARAYLTGDASLWPWELTYFKPRGPIENLTRSGALALAALDIDPDHAGARDTLEEATRTLANALNQV